jgi:hypothetical protein
MVSRLNILQFETKYMVGLVEKHFYMCSIADSVAFRAPTTAKQITGVIA